MNKLKQLGKSSLFKACNLCIALGFILRIAHVSYIFFGELPYPEDLSK